MGARAVWLSLLATCGVAFHGGAPGRRRLGCLEERKARDDFEQRLIDSWESEWDSKKEKQAGFDWEMEKLRRRADKVPEVVFGPKFWRRMLMEDPKSMYRSYAGSTYPGSKPGSVDSFRIIFNNLMQFLGNDSEDGAQVASWDWEGALRTHGPVKLLSSVITGDLQSLVGGPLFLLLSKYHAELGPVYKLAFGPRSFIVIADPAMARFVLKDAAANFDKGILSEILEPIMGTGLIPAAPDVWQQRRRILTPAFHKGWLTKTLALFDDCAKGLVADLREAAAATPGRPRGELPRDVDEWARWKKEGGAEARRTFGVVDMEERFCSVSLDIIGRAVFDFDFDSSTAESPLVRAVYRCLLEAERRANAILPFWLLPGSRFIPSQARFRSDLTLLNTKLDELILQAMREEDTAADDALAVKEQAALKSSSLLKFLVTMRSEDVSSTQLRDDLMTMLVAGHETTAALLTWTLYELFHPSERSKHVLTRLRDEVDAVLGNKEQGHAVTYEDVERMPFARLCLAEGLRLYPQPPLLIRRALDEIDLPRPQGDRRVAFFKAVLYDDDF